MVRHSVGDPAPEDMDEFLREVDLIEKRALAGGRVGEETGVSSGTASGLTQTISDLALSPPTRSQRRLSPAIRVHKASLSPPRPRSRSHSRSCSPVPPSRLRWSWDFARVQFGEEGLEDGGGVGEGGEGADRHSTIGCGRLEVYNRKVSPLQQRQQCTNTLQQPLEGCDAHGSTERERHKEPMPLSLSPASSSSLLQPKALTLILTVKTSAHQDTVTTIHSEELSEVSVMPGGCGLMLTFCIGFTVALSELVCGIADRDIVEVEPAQEGNTEGIAGNENVAPSQGCQSEERSSCSPVRTKAKRSTTASSLNSSNGLDAFVTAFQVSAGPKRPIDHSHQNDHVCVDGEGSEGCAGSASGNGKQEEEMQWRIEVPPTSKRPRVKLRKADIISQSLREPFKAERAGSDNNISSSDDANGKDGNSRALRSFNRFMEQLHARYHYAEAIARPAAEQSSQSMYGYIGKIFHRQEEAFECLNECIAEWEKRRHNLGTAGGNAEVCDWSALSFEYKASGKRKFLVCRLNRLVPLYIKANPLYNHLYEIIREGQPCRLYFDIEFSKEFNPGLDGEPLMHLWKGLVAAKLLKDFGAYVSKQSFLELDSSTDTKFSRHLIVHLPNGALFRNNHHVGRFVNDIAEKLQDVPDTSPLRQLWVMTSSAQDKGKKTLIADLSVYSRNRCFRLFRSCKYGKSAVLTLADSCAWEWEQEGTQKRSDLDYGAMCSDDRRNAALLLASLVAPPVWRAPLELNEQQQDVQQATTVAAAATACAPPLLLDVHGVGNVRGGQRFYREGSSRRCNSQQHPHCSLSPPAGSSSNRGDVVAPVDCTAGLAGSASNQNSSVGGWGPSPFPDLDRFVSEALICTGGVRGKIRRWDWEVQGNNYSRINYQVLHNRWCGNIGRPHRSNNIIIVVDVKLRMAFQRCYDPDCRRYTSPPQCVPEGALPAAPEVESLFLDWALQEALSRDSSLFDGEARKPRKNGDVDDAAAAPYEGRR